MQVKYFDGEIKPEFITSKDNEIAKAAIKTVELVKTRFDKFETAEAAQEIVNFSNTVNKYVNDTAPWTLAKEEKMLECAQVLYTVLESMRFIAVLLSPYCPNIALDIYKQLNLNEKPDEVKLDSLQWGEIEAGKITEKDKIKPVFLRLDSEFAGDKKK
jgi:methionyl-tRNA synthetase